MQLRYFFFDNSCCYAAHFAKAIWDQHHTTHRLPRLASVNPGVWLLCAHSVFYKHKRYTLSLAVFLKESYHFPLSSKPLHLISFVVEKLCLQSFDRFFLFSLMTIRSPKRAIYKHIEQHENYDGNQFCIVEYFSQIIHMCFFSDLHM